MAATAAFKAGLQASSARCGDAVDGVIVQECSRPAVHVSTGGVERQEAQDARRHQDDRCPFAQPQAGQAIVQRPHQRVPHYGTNAWRVVIHPSGSLWRKV